MIMNGPEPLVAPAGWQEKDFSMKKLILIPFVTAFAVSACSERADDTNLESEGMSDGAVTSDVMPEQPALTDPVPKTLPDDDKAGDSTEPYGTGDGMKDETMRPEEKPMLDGRTDQ